MFTHIPLLLGAAHAVAVSRTLHINPVFLSLLLGAPVAGLTHLLVKEKANPQVKWFLLTVLSAISGSLSLVLSQGGTLIPSQFGYSIAFTFIAAVCTHMGLSETGVAASLSAATGNFGFGANSPVQKDFSAAMNVASSLGVPTATVEHLYNVEDRLAATLSSFAKSIHSHLDAMQGGTQTPAASSGVTSVVPTVSEPLFDQGAAAPTPTEAPAPSTELPVSAPTPTEAPAPAPDPPVPPSEPAPTPAAPPSEPAPAPAPVDPSPLPVGGVSAPLPPLS